VPGGKSPSMGVGPTFTKPLSHQISVRSLRCQTHRSAWATISVSDVRELRLELRDIFKRYDMSRRTGQGQTPTERRTQIIQAQKAAKKLLKDPGNAAQRECFLDALSHNNQTRNLLFTYLLRRRADLLRLQRRLLDDDDLRSDEKQTLQFLADLKIREFVPKGRWPDPPLTQLVSELIPIWQRITGLSSFSRNDRNENASHYIARPGEKVSPFADWVEELLRAMGHPAPPSTSIPRIVRILKSEK